MSKIPSVKKVWGREVWLVNTEKYCAKYLYITPGYQCSLHRHLIKDETFLVLKGECVMDFGGAEREMKVGDRAHIPTGAWHRFRNEGSDVCTLLEVSTHHSEADVERKEESRKIAIQVQ